MRTTILYCTPLTLLLLSSAVHSAPFSSPKTNNASPTQGMAYPTPVTPNPTFSADKFKAEVDTRNKQNRDALNKQFEKILPKPTTPSSGNQASPYDPERDSNTSSQSLTNTDKAKPTQPPKSTAPSSNNANDSLGDDPFSNFNKPSDNTPANQEPAYSGFGTKPQNQTNTGTTNQNSSGSKSSGWNVQY